MIRREFWKWFEESNAKLAALTSTAEITDRIYEMLRQIDRRFGVEISEPDSSGVRDIIFSANGIADLFSLVEELVGTAPDVPGWAFTALKPARGFTFVYRQDGKACNSLVP